MPGAAKSAERPRPPEPSDERFPRHRSERWHEERFRNLLEKDAPAFAIEAEHCLQDGSPLAMKVGALRVALDADASLGDRLFALALDPTRTADGLLFRYAAETLIERSEHDAAAWARLDDFVTSAPRGDPSVRARVATAVATNAPDAEVDRLLHAMWRDQNPDVWQATLRGLETNATPRARQLLEELSRTRPWVADAGASDALPGDLEPDGGAAAVVE